MQKYRVRNAQSLSRVLNNQRMRDNLIAMASEARRDQPIGPTGEYSVVAGKGLDLSTHLGCGSLDCVKVEIDTLFRRAWHYFDTIILPDRALQVVVSYMQGGTFHRLNEDLLGPVTVVRELEKLGALEFVRFTARFEACCTMESTEHDPVEAVIARLEGR